MLVDLRPKKATGKVGREGARPRRHHHQQERIPFDPEKPTVTSGIRLGSPAGTTRGFGAAEFRQVGKLIVEVVDAVAKNGADGDAAVEARCAKVRSSVRRFPDLPRLRRRKQIILGGPRCAARSAVTTTPR